MASRDKNLKQSIYSIDVSKGPRSLPVRKGTACAVKTEGSSGAVLVTSQKVVEHGGTSIQGNLSAKQFCPEPDHEAKHLAIGVFQLRHTEQFCFISLQKAPKYTLKLVSVSKLREAGERLTQSKCLSYTFFGNSFKTMTWEFNREEKTHELTEVDPKGEIVGSAYRGSPVVSTEDEDRSVIGVVDCNSDGELCLMFFTERSLAHIKELTAGHRDEAARDVTDSPAPFIPPESRPPAPPPEEEQLNNEGNNSTQDNRTPPPSSVTDLSGPLSLMGIQETNPSGEKKISIERSQSEQNKCLWDQEVQCLESFQQLLTTVLKINLDPKRELGGDYRSLAEALGKDMRYIWFLATAPSPTEELLRDSHLALSLLHKLLLSEEVGRKDVANEITAWVEKQSCSCSKCGSIR